MPAANAPLYRLLGRLEGVRKQASGYVARCPCPAHAHGDRHPSLSVGLGYDGRVVLHCHTGCQTEDVLAALGLGWEDLFDHSAEGRPLRRYRLLDGRGALVATHVREDTPSGKQMRWERNGRTDLGGVRTADLPLYRLPDLLAAEPEQPVVVCEGEKATDAAAEMGLLAVGTVTGAAGTPSTAVLAPLQGREVWLWPDNDAEGRAHMARIAALVQPPPRWVVWPEAPPKGDAADYARAGGTAEGVAALLRDAPAEPAQPAAAIKVWTAAELVGTQFHPPQWAIPDLLPEGLTILGGRPKLGKSWLALGLTVDVTSGQRALRAFPTVPGSTLYMALEDGPRRIQERLLLVLGEMSASPHMHVVTEWPRMDEGGLDALEAWLDATPACRLVVIDTYKKVKSRQDSGRKQLYDIDYESMEPLAVLARAKRVAVVVVFHTRKAESADPLELISGTLGLSGAADAVMVLRRERGQADASLFVTGRDVEERDLALRWNHDDVFGWEYLGSAEQFRLSRERQRILDVLAQMPGVKPMDIAGAAGMAAGNVRYLLFRMVRDGQVRMRDGAYYTCIDTNANSANAELKSVSAPTPSANAMSPVSAVSPVSAMSTVSAVSAHGTSMEALPW